MNEPTFDEDDWLMDGGWFSKTRKAPTKKKKKNRGNRIEKRNAWAITIAYFLLPISCYCTSRDKRRVGRWFTTGLVVMMNHHMCVNVLGCSASTQLSSSRGFHSAFPRRPFFLSSRLFSFISSIFLLFFFPKITTFSRIDRLVILQNASSNRQRSPRSTQSFFSAIRFMMCVGLFYFRSLPTKKRRSKKLSRSLTWSNNLQAKIFTTCSFALSRHQFFSLNKNSRSIFIINSLYCNYTQTTTNCFSLANVCKTTNGNQQETERCAV